MDDKRLKVLATELAKVLKWILTFNQFSSMLTKFALETAHNAKLSDRL